MTRALFALAFLLAALPVYPLPKPAHRVTYEAPPQLMLNIKALLEASREFGVDPMLMFSLTWAESEFNELAIAKHKVWNNDRSWFWLITARGMLQHNPEYQDKHVLKYLPGMHPSNFQWWNPVHSARLGCAMMADYVKRFGTWGALAVYNAGEGRYKQLMKYGRRLPQETIDYQRKILRA